MFRLIVPLQRQSLSSRLYHSTSALRTGPPRPKFNPQDWTLFPCDSGNVELAFWNKKTKEYTPYTPEGMSAAEILAVPGATYYWASVEAVEEYIRQMAEEKVENERLGLSTESEEGYKGCVGYKT